MSDWTYGGAIDRWPVELDKPIIYSDGSTLMAHDLFDPMPEFLMDIEVLFTDGPWNMGNLRSFYTKNNSELPMLPCILGFDEFYNRLFECIASIEPKLCFLEIGKEFLGEYMVNLKRLFRHVTIYNSSYYHKRKNRCYVVQGSQKRLNLHFDDMDEEEIIAAVGKCTDGSMGDLCMGRGLVACAAAKNERRFYGTELNPRRLAVCVERLAKIGVMPARNC